MRKSCCACYFQRDQQESLPTWVHNWCTSNGIRVSPDEAVAAVAATSFPFEVPKLSESMQASEVDFKRGL